MIVHSASWSLIENFHTMKPVITIFNRHGEPTSYLGPDPSSRSHEDCVGFRNAIEMLADANRQNRVRDLPYSEIHRTSWL